MGGGLAHSQSDEHHMRLIEDTGNAHVSDELSLL